MKKFAVVLALVIGLTVPALGQVMYRCTLHNILFSGSPAFCPQCYRQCPECRTIYQLAALS